MLTFSMKNENLARKTNNSQLSSCGLISRDTCNCAHTLNDGQQDNDDEEEESDVKDDAVELVLITIRGFNLITNATTGSYSLVQVEHKALPKQMHINLQLLCHRERHRLFPE